MSFALQKASAVVKYYCKNERRYPEEWLEHKHMMYKQHSKVGPREEQNYRVA